MKVQRFYRYVFHFFACKIHTNDFLNCKKITVPTVPEQKNSSGTVIQFQVGTGTGKQFQFSSKLELELKNSSYFNSKLVLELKNSSKFSSKLELELKNSSKTVPTVPELFFRNWNDPLCYDINVIFINWKFICKVVFVLARSNITFLFVTIPLEKSYLGMKIFPNCPITSFVSWESDFTFSISIISILNLFEKLNI